MPFMELNLKSLETLDDGRVAAAFQHELKRAVQDCIDRPADKKPRTVTLELSIKPIVAPDSSIIEMEGADGEFTIKSKVPTRKSKTYNFRSNKHGQLAFSSESPENAEQTTFEDVDPKTGKVKR